MVRFEKDKLIIEIKTTTPHEDWLSMHASLCDLLRFVNRDTLIEDSHDSAIDLLSNMVPDWETSTKMKGGV
jgi:hypothetical protein